MSLLRRGADLQKAPRPGRRQFWFAILGGFAIVVLTAGATTALGIGEIDKKRETIFGDAPPPVEDPGQKVFVRPKPGKPQTFLILGSDKRYTDNAKDARSDTIMLLRLDPKQAATTMLSIPRDLKVDIPGRGLAKINEAYTIGGAALTAETITALTGLEINHVINVQFRAFRQAINALGCVYTDVDRRYFHSNAGLPIGARYSEIDLQPGYQKLCGTKALEYVRFRHTDSDFVRGARQQDFLRAVKDQVNSSKLIENSDELMRIFGKYTQTDKLLRERSPLLSVVKLGVFSADHPVRQVKFDGGIESTTLPGGARIDYVVASPQQIQRSVDEFLHPPRQTAPKKEPAAPRGTGKGKKKAAAPVAVPGITQARALSQRVVDGAKDLDKLGFPLRFPSRITTPSRFPSQDAVRVYTLKDRAGKPHQAYRVVVMQNESQGQYYGVQGTTWRTPPILNKYTSKRRVHGRDLYLYRDGTRLRLVAWRTKAAVYWVSNTLSLDLTNAQMLEIASTLVI